jgi:hypothetical protein
MRIIRGRIESQGPFVDATAMATSQHVARLKAAGRPVPAPVTVRTLVDTGASGCVLDFGIIARLGLIQTGRTKVHTSTTGPGYEERDQYDVSLFLGSLPGQVASFAVGVVGADLASEGFVAILGWDILFKCILTCNGPSKCFKLKY